MAPRTPYSARLGDRDPLVALGETPSLVRSLTDGWSSADFERRTAPGKWTARQILTHLAQTELVLGTRVRMALAVPDYVAQPFDQDVFIARETGLSGPDAVAALVALGRMNLALFAALAPADREQPFGHPEYGTITVDWVVHQLAGHQLHHLDQLRQIDGHSAR